MLSQRRDAVLDGMGWPGLNTSLPEPLSPLIGRRSEIVEIRQMLEESRLVTLTGAGGSGKTRLALEAAAQVSAQAEPASSTPAFWLDLAPLADPQLLPDHLAVALEVPPVPGRSLVEALESFLRQRALLLALDNCEHLVDHCAALVQRLLLACPQLKILATSREALGLPGERVCRVLPLSLPPVATASTTGEALRAEAVQLFATRALESNPGFRLTDDNAAAVIAICRRLDGLPLALELAAARTRVLSVEQIALRLDDAFRLLTTGGRTSLPRQKTLRGTFDWSFGLLAPEQQMLLRRLAVFSGSFSLEAVEAVCCGDEIEPADALDHLSALVDRSLVLLDPEPDHARYRLLETVRQYAADHLRTAGEKAALRRRHGAYFVDMAERMAPSLFGGQGPPVVMRRLDREHDNLRAASDWAAFEPGNGELALRLCIALHWYWFARGLLGEGARRLRVALERGRGAPPGRRARALVAGGFASVWQGTPQEARPGVEEAVEILRAEGDRFALGYGLTVLGAVLLPENLDAAATALAEAEDIADGLPLSVLTTFNAYWKSRVAQARGEETVARHALEKCLDLGRKLGDLPSIGYSLFALGRLEREGRKLDAAYRALAEALEVHLRVGDRWGIIQDLKELAFVLHGLDQPRRAARVLAAGSHLGRELGIGDLPAEASGLETLASALAETLGETGYAAAVAAGVHGSAGDLLALFDERGNETGDQSSPVPALIRPVAPASGTSASSTSASVLSTRSLRGAAAPVPTDEVPGGPAQLEVAALGPFRIRSTTGDDANDGWTSARTRELLVFLLLHPEGATKEEIGLALWPEASAAQLRNTFHVSLHRLRTALGSPEWVVIQAGRYRLDDHVLGFDVPRFETRMHAALTALAAGHESLDALLEALELYRGELLQGESAGDWHLERRDELQQLFLRGLATAGEALMQAGRYAEAAAIYRRWVSADDLCEDAYRQLMICLEHSGDPNEALRVYRRLVTILDKELGVEPEAATVELFERLDERLGGQLRKRSSSSSGHGR